MSLNTSTTISKTNRHTLSSAATKNRLLFNKKFISFLATILASQFIINVTLQKTNANPVQTFYNDDEVTGDWIDANNGLSNEEEDDISSNIDNALKLYLDEVENDDGSQDGNGQKRSDRSKRFTVEFNGMQVSYPQYMRLVALQEKVVKLKTMINKLNAKYPPELLKELPQYQRLMKLYNSLAPLLPEANMAELEPQRFDELLDPQDEDSDEFAKRSSMSVDFMGMQVSYPQYLRLVALQEKVVKLDKLMRKMLKTRTLEELQKIPKWNTLVALHDALKKMLPQEYVSSHQTFADAKRHEEEKRRAQSFALSEGNDEERSLSKRSMGTVEFNGVQMTYPQYWKLMELQKKVLKLDSVMQRISEKVNDPQLLSENPKWKELVGLRHAMEELMPSTSKRGKRSPTMDFNGVQVSLPQYQHLMTLQRKVMKLDAAMKKISEKSDPEALKNNAKWQALVEMRKSLLKLLPSAKH